MDELEAAIWKDYARRQKPDPDPGVALLDTWLDGRRVRRLVVRLVWTELARRLNRFAE